MRRCRGPSGAATSPAVSSAARRVGARTRGLWLAAVLAWGAGCGTPPTCIDEDLDGRGPGCADGTDCDDANAARGADCDAVPAPDCAATPTATGCPCLAASVSPCGLPEGMDAASGNCEPGRTRCVASHWGLCIGAVGPSPEFCDGQDQDCDGLVDETVRSPCGGCTPGCAGEVWGAPFDDDVLDDLDRTASGALTLRRLEVASSTVWAPNSADGTASRIDGETALETARYATGDGSAFPREPSRVAVDWNGDAWIANRAFEGVASVIRIAGDPTRCEDRDRDGAVRTSSGPTDVLTWGQDECVLASLDVGAEREVARALAIDGDRGLDGASGGNAWVGLHDGHAFVEVDGARGVVLRRIETPGFSPYAAAFDPWGMLWAIERDGVLLRIDPSTEPPTVTSREVPLGCWLLYGLAVDREGRVAMTGFSCDRITVYDPWTDAFTTLPTAPSPRGAAFDGATLWVGHSDGTLSRLSVSPLRVEAHFPLDLDGTRPLETVGVGADGAGHVWAISSQGGGGLAGLATRVDAARGVPDAQVVLGTAPHVQGDPTGAHRLGEFVPEGRAQHVFGGCGAEVPTRWQRLHVEAVPGTHGTVTIDARHAAEAAGLPAAPWRPVGMLPGGTAPFDLAVPVGGVLEVRVSLSVGARIGAPRVARIGVEWACPGPE